MHPSQEIVTSWHRAWPQGHRHHPPRKRRQVLRPARHARRAPDLRGHLHRRRRRGLPGGCLGDRMEMPHHDVAWRNVLHGSRCACCERRRLPVQHTPGIYREEQLQGWRPVVEAVREKGGVFFLQLWHCGRSSTHAYQPDGGPPVSASAIPITDGTKVFNPRTGQVSERSGLAPLQLWRSLMRVSLMHAQFYTAGLHVDDRISQHHQLKALLHPRAAARGLPHAPGPGAARDPPDCGTVPYCRQERDGSGIPWGRGAWRQWM